MSRGDKFYEELLRELNDGEEILTWAEASWLKSGKMTEAESGIIAITNRRFAWRGSSHRRRVFYRKKEALIRRMKRYLKRVVNPLESSDYFVLTLPTVLVSQ